MAAVWAFCVGVQAEDVDCLPSPNKVSNEDPTLSTTASPHLTHGELLLWGGFIPEEFML